MLLNSNIEIVVFEVTNDNFEALGPINNYTALIWSESFRGYMSFELWCPINDETRKLVKHGNILWIGSGSAAVIEIVKSTVDKFGVKGYNIKGRTLEKFLCDRIVWGTYNKSAKPSTIMYNLVNSNFVNPSNADRKLKYLICDNDGLFGDTIRYQKTGGTVYDALKDLADSYDLGFHIEFKPNEKQMVFKVTKIIDKSTDNRDGNESIELSTDLSDILSSEYYVNVEGIKNVTLVQGEGEGINRTSIAVGEISSKGFNRKELYVDARDLQSTSYDESGQQVVLTPEQYRELLVNRGTQKLSDNVIIENFDASIRQFGTTQYQFGVDYNKGDIITVIDNNLGISVDAVVSSVQYQYSDTYNVALTFGFSYPTLVQRLKNVLS